MKQYILLICLFIVIYGCNAQDNRPAKTQKEPMDLSFIKNDKLEYEIVLRACEDCFPITNIGYRVAVHISENEYALAKEITPDMWFKLLNDSTSDFAANVILYSLYDKNAAALSMNNNKSEWRKDMKSDDLEYWRIHLK